MLFQWNTATILKGLFCIQGATLLLLWRREGKGEGGTRGMTKKHPKTSPLCRQKFHHHKGFPPNHKCKRSGQHTFWTNPQGFCWIHCSTSCKIQPPQWKGPRKGWSCDVVVYENWEQLLVMCCVWFQCGLKRNSPNPVILNKVLRGSFDHLRRDAITNFLN